MFVLFLHSCMYIYLSPLKTAPVFEAALIQGMLCSSGSMPVSTCSSATWLHMLSASHVESVKREMF